jgi:predicted transcriptional regulator
MDKRMKYRCRADIIAAILQSMSSGNMTMTRLMYGSFISYSQAKEYLTFLEKKDMIRLDTPSATYGLTEQGAKVLGKLRDLGTLLSIEETPVSSDRIWSYTVAQPVVMRSRSRVADKRELDSRPIVSA